MSEQTQETNWEAVKVLALAVGVRESARRLGLNEEAVKRRCTREGWLNDPMARQVATKSIKERSCPIVSPAQAMAMELAGNGQRSRIALSRGMAKASEHIETLQGAEIVADASNVKAIAQTAATVFGWADQANPSRVRLDVLLSRPEQTIDIEAHVVEPEWDTEEQV